MTRIAQFAATLVAAFALSACGVPEGPPMAEDVQVESSAQAIGGITSEPDPDEGCTSSGGWVTCTYPIATKCQKGWTSCTPSGSDSGCCKRRATGM